MADDLLKASAPCGPAGRENVMVASSGEPGNCKKYQNSGNEAKNLLKTKEVAFSRDAKRTQNEPKKGSKNHLSDVFEAKFGRHESAKVYGCHKQLFD